MAKTFLLSALVQNGFSEARVEKIEVSFGHATVYGLSLDHNDRIKADRIDITYHHIAALLNQHLDRIFINNLSLAAYVNKDGFMIPGSQGFWRWDEPLELNFDAIPFKSLMIGQAGLLVFSDRGGQLQIDLSGELDKSEDGSVDLNIYAAKRPNGNFGLSAHAEGKIYNKGPWYLSINIEGDNFNLPGIQIGRISGDLTFHGKTLSEQKVAGKIRTDILNFAGFPIAAVNYIEADLLGSVTDFYMMGRGSIQGVENEVLNFSMRYRAPDIIFETITLPVFGGTIGIKNLLLSNKTTISEASVSIDDLNIETLVQQTGAKGFKMTGILRGSAYLSIKNGRPFIRDGILKSVHGGIIHIDPSHIPAFLQGDNPQIVIARNALQDLIYETLTLSMDGPVFGDMDVHLFARGKNPHIFEDRPIEFNLNSEGFIVDLLRKSFYPHLIWRKI